MKKTIGIFAIGLSLLLGACGSTEDLTSGAGEEEMEKELSQQLKEQDGDYSLVITNGTEEDITLTFPSGQQFEYQLLDESGEVVNTYSMNKSFIQGLTEHSLAAGEEWEIPLHLKDELAAMNVPAGEYQLDVWSLAEQFDGEKISMNDFNWAGQ